MCYTNNRNVHKVIMIDERSSNAITQLADPKVMF